MKDIFNAKNSLKFFNLKKIYIIIINALAFLKYLQIMTDIWKKVEQKVKWHNYNAM